MEAKKHLLLPLGLRKVDFALGWEAVDWAEAELVAALLSPVEAELAHFGPDGSAEALGSMNEPPDHLYLSHFGFGYVYRPQAAVENDPSGHFGVVVVGFEEVDDYLFHRGAEHTRHRK